MGRPKNNAAELRGGGNRVAKAEDRTTKSLLKKAKEKIAHTNKKEAPWRKELQRFKEQLQSSGFELKEIPGDGNCLFRAIADQVEGAQDKHEKYRARIVEYLRDNSDNFAPFIIDTSFDVYCKQMGTLGVWGGNIELQAASLALQVNITVHQLDHPRWQILNFSEDTSPMIHLSYHDGRHYNTLRPIRLQEAKAAVLVQKAANSGKQTSCLDKEKENKIKIAMQSTGYSDRELVVEILRDCEFDLDATIETLVSMKQISDGPASYESAPTMEDTKTTTTISASSSPYSTPASLSLYLDDLSLYDEEQALTASLIEYELSLAESAAMASSVKAPSLQSTKPTLTTTTSPTTTSPTNHITTTDVCTLTTHQPSTTESVSTLVANHNGDKPTKQKKCDNFEQCKKAPKQRLNKKASTNGGQTRKLSNKERKMLNKKQQEEERKEQKLFDMQRLMEELQLSNKETYGTQGGGDSVVDLGVVLI